MAAPSSLTPTDLAPLRQRLGAYTFELAGGRVHVCKRTLPPGVPAAVVTRDGELWVIIDDTKPLAHLEAWELIREHGDKLVERCSDCCFDETSCPVRILRIPTPRGEMSAIS